jgi:hypothetical protein
VLSSPRFTAANGTAFYLERERGRIEARRSYRIAAAFCAIVATCSLATHLTRHRQRVRRWHGRGGSGNNYLGVIDGGSDHHSALSSKRA